MHQCVIYNNNTKRICQYNLYNILYINIFDSNHEEIMKKRHDFKGDTDIAVCLNKIINHIHFTKTLRT